MAIGLGPKIGELATPEAIGAAVATTTTKAAEAEASRAAAAIAKTAAEAAAAQAAAPTDAQNKALIEDPASLTAGALTATIATGVESGIEESAYLPATFTSRRALIGNKPFDLPRATPKNNAWIIGFDGTTTYYADQAGIYRSTDDGLTLSNNLTFPTAGQANAGNDVHMILRAGAWLYCHVQNPVANVAELWRAAPTTGNTALSWAKVLTQTPGSSSAFYGHLATDGTSIIVIDYGDPLVGGVPTSKIFRTLVSDGLTWATVLTVGAPQRHFHAIAADPYKPGRYIITLGDAPNPSALKSDDSGLTWSGISVVTERYQSVDVSFSPDFCFLASDTMRSDGFVLPRESLAEIQHVSTSDHRSFALPRPGYYGFGGYTTSGSAVFQDFVTLPFKASDVGRRITGTGIPNGTTILSYQSAAQVTLSQNATATASATVAYTIERPEQVAGAVVFGRVDPATGIYYFLANFEDGTEVYPMRAVLFYCLPDGRTEALDYSILGRLNAVLVHNGRLFYGRYSRPLLQIAQPIS